MIKPEDFETYAAIIRSGQMPQADVPLFMEENADFKSWYADKFLGPETISSPA